MKPMKVRGIVLPIILVFMVFSHLLIQAFLLSAQIQLVRARNYQAYYAAHIQATLARHRYQSELIQNLDQDRQYIQHQMEALIHSNLATEENVADGSQQNGIIYNKQGRACGLYWIDVYLGPQWDSLAEPAWPKEQVMGEFVPNLGPQLLPNNAWSQTIMKWLAEQEINSETEVSFGRMFQFSKVMHQQTYLYNQGEVSVQPQGIQWQLSSKWNDYEWHESHDLPPLTIDLEWHRLSFDISEAEASN
ncbi:hypothetical protein [Vaginisenegalia massiliensis]|uniref:hypothetical protein n=1 Tax=Vaginisenegalia massiliensis TaxID=2058294 RepID=UPI000F524569|nr:hypothetical protein [Vaginisenegalia massiliensis]